MESILIYGSVENMAKLHGQPKDPVTHKIF